MHAHSDAELFEYAQLCLTTLQNLLPSCTQAFYLIAPDGQISRFLDNTATAELNQRYLQHFWRHDPLYPSRGLRSGRVQSLSHICRTQGGSVIYTDFLRSNAVGDVADIYIETRPGQAVAGISLLRSLDQPRFASSELCHLHNLLPLLDFSARGCHAFNSGRQCPNYGLTRREIELAEQIRRGLSNAQIAQALAISITTVKTHVKHLLAKVGVSNRTELVARLFLEAT